MGCLPGPLRLVVSFSDSARSAVTRRAPRGMHSLVLDGTAISTNITFPIPRGPQEHCGPPARGGQPPIQQGLLLNSAKRFLGCGKAGAMPSPPSSSGSRAPQCWPGWQTGGGGAHWTAVCSAPPGGRGPAWAPAAAPGEACGQGQSRGGPSPGSPSPACQRVGGWVTPTFSHLELMIWGVTVV